MQIELRISTSVSLSSPTADDGLVTWLSVDIVRLDGDEDDRKEASLGNASVAMIHVGETANVGESLFDVLDADSDELHALTHVFFDEETRWLREPYANGTGSSLLYVSELEIEPPWQRRMIEQAAVRRLADTVGEGAAIVVVPFDVDTRRDPWMQIGFTVVTEPTDGEDGYLVLDTSLKHPRLAPSAEDNGCFEVRLTPDVQ
jgi:hypothetical protein